MNRKISYISTMATNEEIEINPVQIEKMQKVESLIKELESGGPCGIFHLEAASAAINAQIDVVDENGDNILVIGGDNKLGTSAKIEYHKPIGGRKIGHFTLTGNLEPLSTTCEGSNMCLFNVLSELTGKEPETLKTLTLNMLKSNKTNLAKQIDDNSFLEKYSQIGLVVGGAAYTSRYPDDGLSILRNSTGTVAYMMRNPGHPHHHAPFRGTTDQKLEAIAEELERPIIAYDSRGEEVYTKGMHFQNAPIELDYYKDTGDTSSEWFTSRGGNESRYRAYEPGDENLYNIISTLADCDPAQLKAATENRVNEIPIPPGKYCVERASINQFKTGFMSEFDMAYAVHHVLRLPIAQRQMESLNRINFNESLPWHSYRRALNIDVSDLETDRIIYGQEWNRGSRRPVSQAKKIFVLLTHHNGQERDPDAPVHVQTTFLRL